VAQAVPGAAQNCTAAKLVASGNFLSCRLNADAAYALSGDAAKWSADLGRCSQNLAKDFQKAEAKFGAACVVVEPLAQFESFLAECSDQTNVAGSGGNFPSPPCGDGAISEQCDGADLGGQSCVSLLSPVGIYFGSGTLRCNSSCQYDTSGCLLPFCGDGVINAPGEECDGTDFGILSCEFLGHTGGTLVCASDCMVNSTGCTDLR
jgi:hypothetical protein